MTALFGLIMVFIGMAVGKYLKGKKNG